MAAVDIVVPDLGSDGKAEVIEILVQPGMKVSNDQIIVVLESDKATMEIPCEFEGVLTELLVKVGDQVSSGDLLARLENSTQSSPQMESTAKVKTDKNEKKFTAKKAEATIKQKVGTSVVEKMPVGKTRIEKTIVETVPDTGEGTAELIEIHIKVGDEVQQDAILVVLESDKATMEIPASRQGKVTKILVNLGDKLKHGDPLVELLVSETGNETANEMESETKTEAKNQTEHKQVSDSASQAQQVKKSAQESRKAVANTPQNIPDFTCNKNVHAGPAARRLARELGVDLSKVQASGPKDRILKDDIKLYVKQNLNKVVSSGSPPLFDLPEIDFSKFGEVETQALRRIKKVSAKNLARSWVNIPHVTQFDEADITELEDFRKEQAELLKQQGIKLTLLAFLVKASANALKEYPAFNASLDKNVGHLILKKYFNIGVAVDTPDGLVVPVVKGVNNKSISDIARELSVLSEKARDKKLMPQDMQGACFSISSLGGIGGTAFTPIVNWPEVAILGVSRSMIKPVYIDKKFEPRLMLPLSLSYDHRVIDGAAAARFTRYFSDVLGDIRKLSL